MSERHLATKFYNGTIVIYDLATFEQTQILHSNSEPRSVLDIGGFCITSDILVNLKPVGNDASRVLIVRKFYHETGLYGPGEMVPVEFDPLRPLIYLEQIVYCWKKYIIVDMSQKSNGEKLRTVLVFDIKSLKPVRERTFTTRNNIFIKEVSSLHSRETVW